MTEIVKGYSWPGNVRELKHYVERMAAMGSDGAEDGNLPTSLAKHTTSASGMGAVEFAFPTGGAISLVEGEKRVIKQALVAANGNRQRVADVLGIGRTTLYRKMRAYDLFEKSDGVPPT